MPTDKPIEEETLDAVDDQIGQDLRDISDDRLDAASLFPDISFDIQDDASVEAQKDRVQEFEADHVFSMQAHTAALGFGEVTKDLGEAVGLRAAAIREGLRGGAPAGDVWGSLLDPYRVFDSEEWNTTGNENTSEMFNSDMALRGIDLDDPRAIDLAASSSMIEYSTKIERLDQDRRDNQMLQDSGTAGLITYMGASLFDLDVVLGGVAFKGVRQTATLDKLKNSVTAAEFAQLQKVTTRSGNLVSGAVAGAAGATLVEGTRAILDPSVDGRDFVGALLATTAFGGTLGALVPTRSAARVATDIAEVRAMETLNTAERAMKGASPELDLEASVGSGRVKTTEIRIPESSQDVIDHVDNWIEDDIDQYHLLSTLGDFVDENASPASRAAQMIGEKMYAGINKTPFISDYDNLIKHAGDVGKYLGYHGYTSPVGQVANNRAGTNIADMLQRRVSTAYAPNAGNNYKAWAKDKGYPIYKKQWHVEGQAEYNRLLHWYKEEISAGRTPENVHPSIVRASEELDLAYERLLTNNQKYGVEGYADIEYKKGYTPRNWDRGAVVKAEQAIGTTALLRTLTRAIMAKSSGLDENLAFAYAAAIRRHAFNKDIGDPMGSLGAIPQNGRLLIEEALADLGIGDLGGQSPKELLEKVFGEAERGAPARSKSRIDLDMNTPIDGTQWTLLDLVDNDVYALADSMSRNQSQRAGLLAGTGIQQSQKEMWLRATADDLAQAGKSPEDIERGVRAVDQFFSYFSDGAFAGGAHPNAARLNTLAYLSYLPQLGITQIAETGVAMATVGPAAWSRYAGQTLQDMVKGRDNDVLNSLLGGIQYAPDELQFVRKSRLDDANLDDSGHYLKMLDTAMEKGLRGMGHVSGFYRVNEFMQRLAGTSMNDYMIRKIVAGTESRRLTSMGVDDEFRKLVLREVDAGNITFDADGYVNKMDTAGWSELESDMLEVITMRNIRQTVQKPGRGEAHAWQYETLGSLFSSMKGFVFTAAQKQLIRNLRLADGESFQMALTTTLSSALAYTVKQAVNGRLDEMDAEELTSGTLKWSTLFGPMMMAIDPVSYMAGIDHVTGSSSTTWRYGSQGMVSIAGLSALNDLSGIGRIPLDALTGDGLDQTSKQALRSVPVAGRMHGVRLLEEMINE